MDFSNLNIRDSGLVLPSKQALDSARAVLVTTLPNEGLGEERAKDILEKDVCSALNGSSKTPNYYGFVTGGSTPIAQLADNIVTHFDNQVQVHLPDETIASDVENAALKLLADLLKFDIETFEHATFTTGATASNVLGMACGRQWVIREAAKRNGVAEQQLSDLCDVGKVGIVKAMKFANLDEIQVLSTVPHSSLAKACSVVGLGRESIKLVNKADAAHKFDLEALERELATPRSASIVAVSCSEVNTGLFASTGEEMKKIRELCDKYGAWNHVDGAFGIVARCLDPKSEYTTILAGVANMELADSITGDAHKLLNVPYDCGFFYSKSLKNAFEVFQNAGAAYLAAGPATPIIPSPLHHGIENSRRFRALPVYANLITYGRSGFQDMLQRQIALARRISASMKKISGYEVLSASAEVDKTFIIVLFRSKIAGLNAELVKRINGTCRVYVSGTKWEGKPACRFAVSHWAVDVERDIKIIEQVLQEVVYGWIDSEAQHHRYAAHLEDRARG